MKDPMHRHSGLFRALLLVTASSLAGGCQYFKEPQGDPALSTLNGTTHMSRPEPEVKRAAYRHEVAFMPGDATLAAASQQDLDAFVDEVGIAAADEFMIIGPNQPSPLSSRQRQMVASYLALKGVNVAALPADAAYAPAADDNVSVILRRKTVVLPACPDWTSVPNQSFTNRPQRNFGCSSAVNLGMMIATPTDLERGRGLGPKEGTVSAKSIERYRKGRTKELIRDAGSSDVFPAANSGSDAGAEK
jgi:pilus biogenesis lipoprotein CpaD